MTSGVEGVVRFVVIVAGEEILKPSVTVYFAVMGLGMLQAVGQARRRRAGVIGDA